MLESGLQQLQRCTRWIYSSKLLESGYIEHLWNPATNNRERSSNATESVQCLQNLPLLATKIDICWLHNSQHPGSNKDTTYYIFFTILELPWQSREEIFLLMECLFTELLILAFLTFWRSFQIYLKIFPGLSFLKKMIWNNQHSSIPERVEDMLFNMQKGRWLEFNDTEFRWKEWTICQNFNELFNFQSKLLVLSQFPFPFLFPLTLVF